MRNLLSAAIASLAALLLSGCFITDKPLFDAKGAIYPFQSGTTYVQYLDDDKGGWKEYSSGTLVIKDGWYVATSKAKSTDSITFLLAPWGKNYLAVAKSENSKKQTAYLYGVLSPGDGGFLEYSPECNELDPAVLKKMGLVTYKPGEEDNCHPVSLDALKAIMRRMLASKTKPSFKYVVVK